MAGEELEKAIDGEVNSRVEGVAEIAAAQLDQANKDAEAIARAALASEQMQRFNSFQEENNTWRTERLTREAAAETRLAELEKTNQTISSALAALLAKQQSEATSEVSIIPEVKEPSSESEGDLSDGEKTRTEPEPPRKEPPKRRML